MILAGILGTTVIYGVDKSSAVLDLTIHSLCDDLDRPSPEAGGIDALHTAYLKRVS